MYRKLYSNKALCGVIGHCAFGQLKRTLKVISNCPRRVVYDIIYITKFNQTTGFAFLVLKLNKRHSKHFNVVITVSILLRAVSLYTHTNSIFLSHSRFRSLFLSCASVQMCATAFIYDLFYCKFIVYLTTHLYIFIRTSPMLYEPSSSVSC